MSSKKHLIIGINTSLVLFFLENLSKIESDIYVLDDEVSFLQEGTLKSIPNITIISLTELILLKENTEFSTLWHFDDLPQGHPYSKKIKHNKKPISTIFDTFLFDNINYINYIVLDNQYDEKDEKRVYYYNYNNVRINTFKVPCYLGQLISNEYMSSDVIDLIIFEMNNFMEQITSRIPDYFRYNDLHLLLQNVQIPLVSLEKLAEVLVKIGAEEHIQSGDYMIEWVETVSFTELYNLIVDVFDNINISLVYEYNELSLFERNFNDRLDHVIGQYKKEDSSSLRVVKIGNEEEKNDLKSNLKYKVNLENSCVPLVYDEKVDNKKIVCRKGFELNYQVYGNGPVIVIINALATGKGLWEKVIRGLSREFKIIVWDCRGVFDDASILDIHDHVLDLKEILDSEKTNSVTLLSWCTGTKISIIFERTFPMYVNLQLQLGGRYYSSEISPWTKSLIAIGENLKKRPELSSVFMKRLSDLMSERIDPGTLDYKKMESALTKVPIEYLECILKVYSLETAFVKYLQSDKLFTDFCIEKYLPTIKSKVILITSSYDMTVPYNQSVYAFDYIPQCELIIFPGSTHFLPIERHSDIVWICKNYIGR